VLRKLFTEKEYLQKVILQGLFNVDHFADLMHRDAFRALLPYYAEFGSLPDHKKFSAWLVEKDFVTSAAHFKDFQKQVKLWQSASEKFFHPLSKVEKESYKSAVEYLEKLRKARKLQTAIGDIYGAFEAGKYDDGFKVMSHALISDLGAKNRVMEGDLPGDWHQHQEVMKLQKSGIIKPVPSGIVGAKIDLEDGTHTLVKLDNHMYGGFWPDELTIIIGETKVGKSFLLAELAYQAAVHGFNVIYFTIEMDKMKAQRRLYSRISGIPYRHFRMATLSEKQDKFIKKRLDKFDRNCGKLWAVSFSKGATVNEVERKAYETQNRFGLEWDFMVVDYLNDMKAEGRYQSSKGWEAMGEISWSLAELTKDFNDHTGIPIVTANQKRGDKARQSRTNWDDAAFAKQVMHHASQGFGIGQDSDDKAAHRIRFDLFLSRDDEQNVTFYMYPNLAISRISSLKKLNEQLGGD
jgi:replicative DNA helicase